MHSLFLLMFQCKISLMHSLFHLKYMYNGIFVIKNRAFIAVPNLAYAILCEGIYQERNRSLFGNHSTRRERLISSINSNRTESIRNIRLLV